MKTVRQLKEAGFTVKSVPVGCTLVTYPEPFVCFNPRFVDDAIDLYEALEESHLIDGQNALMVAGNYAEDEAFPLSLLTRQQSARVRDAHNAHHRACLAAKEAQAAVGAAGEALSNVLRQLTVLPEPAAVPRLRQGALQVELTSDAYLYNDTHFTLEISVLTEDGEFEENEADVSGLPIDASADDITCYLKAALAAAIELAGPEHAIRRVAGQAAAAGMAAVAAAHAGSAAPDWTTPPMHCPYCGGAHIQAVAEWEATSADGPENTANLREYQCQGDCQGRSFWC